MSRPSYLFLADVLCPTTFDEIEGQPNLRAAALEQLRTDSLELWGQTCTGNTTIALVLGAENDFVFFNISAVFDGVGELRKIFAAAKARARWRPDNIVC